MMSMIFYGLLIYYVVKFVNKNWIRNFLVFVLVWIILSVGVSRIYLGVHYATDVLAGFVFGLIYLFVFTSFLKKHNV